MQNLTFTISLLALSAAFFAALNNVFIKKGLDYGSRAEAVLLSLSTSIVLYCIILITTGLINQAFSSFALWFVAAGAFAPGAARVLNATSFQRVGVSKAMPIIGIAPLFATVIAIIFLNETFSFIILTGIILIILGIYVLSRQTNDNGKRFDKKDLLYPLAAAFCGGMSITLSKQGLITSIDPLVGAATATTTAFVVATCYLLAKKEIKPKYPSKKILLFSIFAGTFMVCAFVLHFTALQLGQVSVVAPLFGTFPLFATFLSRIIVKEKITTAVFLAAVLTFFGVALITIT